MSGSSEWFQNMDVATLRKKMKSFTDDINTYYKKVMDSKNRIATFHSAVKHVFTEDYINEDMTIKQQEALEQKVIAYAQDLLQKDPDKGPQFFRDQDVAERTVKQLNDWNKTLGRPKVYWTAQKNKKWKIAKPPSSLAARLLKINNP
jgi:hypothetical protein